MSEPGADQRTCVLIVGSDAAAREELRRAFRQSRDFRVIAVADLGQETAHLVYRLHPAVVVIDAMLADSGAQETTRRIRATVPSARVVGYADTHDQETALREAGAVAIVRKGEPVEELIEAVRAMRP